MTLLTPQIPRHILIRHEDREGDGEAEAKVPDSTFSTANLPLVDEIDLHQCLVSPSRTYSASAIQGVVIGKRELEVICPTNIDFGSNDYQACPCCRRYVSRDSRAGHHPYNVGDAKMEGLEQEESNTISSMLHNGLKTAVTSLSNQQTALEGLASMAAPPLVSGDKVNSYTITKTIVQGWLYKKGSGNDMTGRRWWKPRWVTLAMAENSYTQVPTPIILSHRAPGVPYPASVTELTESTVVMAIERTTAAQKKGAGEDEWNRHCFQIVSKTATRIFTAPESAKERNEWVFAMNNALLAHEKQLCKARICKLQQQTRKARRSGFCSSLDEEMNYERSAWTKKSRVRSPSPARKNKAHDLPPTSPRGIVPSSSRGQHRQAIMPMKSFEITA